MTALGSRLSALGGRYREFVEKVERAVLESPGHIEPALRQAIASRKTSDIPEALRSYADKVALHAYRVTDADIEGLLRAGYSEDEIFEVTAAAALGAALERLELGLAALEKSEL
jgi:alkylhydroperoxidase family enzyme